MTDSGIFATTQEIQDKAGANASATSNVEAYTNRFIAQAESRINTESEYNWSDVYDDLNDDVKKILSEAASNLAAIYVINYDMSGFSTLNEATTMVNILYTCYYDCIKLLRETDKGQIFVREA